MSQAVADRGLQLLTQAQLENNRLALEKDKRLESRALMRLTLPALLIVGLLMVAPIAWLLSMSLFGQNGELSFENYSLFFDEPVYRDMFLNTFEVAFLVTLVTVLLGYPVSYLLVILPARWSGLLMLAVLVPFWTSGLVRTFSWIIILQRNGVINSLLVHLGIIHHPIPLVYNMTGVIVGMVHIMVPFLVLPLYASMKAIDGNLLRAAANLGATPAHAFRTIFLPLSMPGLIAGTIMVFVMCLGYYITPSILGGGKVKMIAQRIQESLSLYPTWGPAAALAVLLLAVTAICLGASLLLVRQLSSSR
ncbi:ABC transporter permease [Mesorhizobium sp. VK25A]|uniref:ABC transporter permease n=1 Tax=Mesorhizobium vachelliae TaxID=3072309 RepID=A0ABU5A5V1_9HYPH|nr:MULTISPECIES: ABC transporter permease [unclassified Mesorhizobium]MDX8533085.1 ABC transporter permease [Mesorhizobium sp. VK25D]MDX8545004.1 ABC transporter permease [Mesorhizobium sp. VK25A]